MRGFEDQWFNDFARSVGPFRRAVDEQMREAMQMFAKMSPGFGREPKEFGYNAEIVDARLDDKGMHLKLNVSHYEPGELSVKIVDERLIISAKHEKKSDEHGFVSREFSREFLLPEGVDKDSLHSRLTDDGHLIITAKVKAEAEPESRNIAIERESDTSCSSSDEDKTKS